MSNLPNYKAAWNSLAETEHSALIHVAGYTDEAQLKISTEVTLRMLQMTIGIKPTDTFLEIGCGVGRVGQYLAPKVTHWIGCDVSENMLAHAGRRLKGIPNISLRPISGYDLSPIPDSSVDAVYCTVVFMHLEEWDRFGYMKEAFRILKPGGRFMCDNANLESEGGWGLFQSSASIAADERPRHISRCSTEAEFKTFLKHAGFSEIKLMLQDLWVFGWGTKPL
jgi:ubiquinone/menaquinone biosynthesis C-methylase UbiE